MNLVQSLVHTTKARVDPWMYLSRVEKFELSDYPLRLVKLWLRKEKHFRPKKEKQQSFGFSQKDEHYLPSIIQIPSCHNSHISWVDSLKQSPTKWQPHSILLEVQGQTPIGLHFSPSL